MLSPNIRLILALVLAASLVTLLVISLSAVHSSVNAEATATPITAKVLRRKEKLKENPNAEEKAALRNQATPEPERKFEDEIPKHVPIKWKFKAEKEKKFKDLKNPGWYRDFELEVTNTSDKPVYFLELWLVYPEIDAGRGAPLGVPLRYGRLNFIYQDTRPLPTDVPIKPGDTYVFTIPESHRKGWEAHKKHENTPDPNRVLLWFVHLSFGDGTGFGTSAAKPFPFRKDQSSSPPCREGPARMVAAGGPLNDRSITFDQDNLNHELSLLTGRRFAGYFSGGKGSFSFLGNSSSALDACCGSGCYFMKPSMDSCACGESPGNSYPACTDPEAACGTPQEIGHWCSDLGVYCPAFRIDACVEGAPPPPSPIPTPSSQPSPTPIPTPTPEPTCDPATRPNNTNCICDTIPAMFGGTPQWSCHCFVTGPGGVPLSGRPANYGQFPGTQGYGGCPPNMYNNGSRLLRMSSDYMSRWQHAEPFHLRMPDFKSDTYAHARWRTRRIVVQE